MVQFVASLYLVMHIRSDSSRVLKKKSADLDEVLLAQSKNIFFFFLVCVTHESVCLLNYNKEKKVIAERSQQQKCMHFTLWFLPLLLQLSCCSHLLLSLPWFLPQQRHLPQQYFQKNSLEKYFHPQPLE